MLQMLQYLKEKLRVLYRKIQDWTLNRSKRINSKVKTFQVKKLKLKNAMTETEGGRG